MNERIPPYLRAAPAAVTPAGHAAALRPFVLTAGRVDPADRAVDVETQVSLRHAEPGTRRAPLETLGPEMQAIVALCTEPMSVAEISARLRLHLGVTRILVADLRLAGYLDVHVDDTQAPLSADTILRVMHGLRALS
ncbi:MAG TPA: DUF742 domain-containing protein [Actinoplanes sp.]|nr:DUF742 domain-containing protein [Actinoplanes sp.]